MDRVLTHIDESAVDRLIDREQARFREIHPKSAQAWARGRAHFLYGGPSHWMRRWAGGFPVYVASATARTSSTSMGAPTLISVSAIRAACAAMVRSR